MKQIAIIGPTASGKTALSIEMAQKLDAYILSLDSLSVYKEVDIASAKPTIEERTGIPHFGIDEIYINEPFNVVKYFDIYKKAKDACKRDKKNLIIVGGSSFYLKALIDGLTRNLSITKEIKLQSREISKDLKKAYEFIRKKDANYAIKINPNDRYRIEKWFEIYLSSGEIATIFYKKNSKESYLKNLEIYNIEINKKYLEKRIKLRTKDMIKQGLIDEVYYLEKKYGRNLPPMKAIGIIETLKYLDGFYDKNKLFEEIVIHTRQLAKRQITFNKTQFKSFKVILKLP